MDIIKHKDVHMDVEEILEIVNGKPVPPGLSVDVGPDHIVIQPEDRVNLFGEYGPDTDYELIYYREEDEK